MTFEEILDYAKRVRTATGQDDLTPTALVERLGDLVAVVTLPFQREPAFDLTIRTGVGFGASSMTLLQDTYMDDTNSETRRAVQEGTYQHGDMQRAIESGKGKPISSAIAVTRAE